MIAPDNEDLKLWRKQLVSLTPAEWEVTDLLADGFTVDEIKSRRSLSEHTIRYQIKTTLWKFEVHSQAQLIARLWHIRYDDYKQEMNPCWQPCDPDCEIGPVHCMADHLPRHKWGLLLHTNECYLQLREKASS